MKSNNSNMLFGLFFFLPILASDCQEKVSFSPDIRTKPILIEQKSRSGSSVFKCSSNNSSPIGSFNDLEKTPIAVVAEEISAIVKFIDAFSIPMAGKRPNRFDKRPPSPRDLASIYGEKHPETSALALSIAMRSYNRQLEEPEGQKSQPADLPVSKERNSELLFELE